MSKYLSEELIGNMFNEELEEILFDENIIIDIGFNLEIYGNPDGKHDEESSNGASVFIFIDQEITYGELLKLFDELGSVKDDTLTIRVVEEEETQEVEFCKDNPISKLIRK